MQDSPKDGPYSQKDDPWASLADTLGVGPGEEPARPASPPPARKPTPPPRPAAEKPQPASSGGDWDSLASDLGIQPAKPTAFFTSPPSAPSAGRPPASRPPVVGRDDVARDTGDRAGLDRDLDRDRPRRQARDLDRPRDRDGDRQLDRPQAERPATRRDAPAPDTAGDERRGDERPLASADDEGGERRRRRRGRRGGRGRRRDRDDLDTRGAVARDEAAATRPAYEGDLAENLWDPDAPVTPAAARPADRDPAARDIDRGTDRGYAPARDEAGAGPPAAAGSAMGDDGDDQPRKRRRRGRRGGRGRSRTGRDTTAVEGTRSTPAERGDDRRPVRGPADDYDDEPLPASYGSREDRDLPPAAAAGPAGSGTAGDEPERRRRRRSRRSENGRGTERRRSSPAGSPGEQRSEADASSAAGAEPRRSSQESRQRGGESGGRSRRRRDRREPAESRSSGYSRGRRGDFAPVAGSHDEDDEGLEFLGVEEAGRRRETHGEEDDVIVESGLSTVLDVPSWVEAIGIVIAGNLDARSRSGRGEGRSR